MRGNEAQQLSLETLENLPVFAQNTGRSVALAQVATIIPEWQYSKIKRLNLRRTVNVSSELTADGNASDVTSELSPWMDTESEKWPPGYSYAFGGDAQNTADNMGAVINYLPLSGFIILLLLIIQFQLL